MRLLAIDVLGLVGLAGIVIGAWWAFPPAGLMALGAALLVAAVLLSVKGPPKGSG